MIHHRSCKTIWLVLLHLLFTTKSTTTEALAGRSSSKRKKNAGAGGASKGGGFGRSTARNEEVANYHPDDSPSTRTLVSFLKKEECEGIGAEGGTEIGICSATGRRGLFAADDYQAGEMMLGVPFPCCVTLAMDDISVGESSDPELGLRLFNLLSDDYQSGNDQERNSVNFGPYFQSFPTREEHFDATPDFWTVPEIEQLDLPPIIEKALERKEGVRMLAQAQNVNESELQFATWLVKSRGFTLLKATMTTDLTGTGSADDTMEEQQTSIASKTVLMPYLDMINHNNPESANAELQVLETKVEEESFYALQATRPIKKGTEITIAYGTGKESTVDLLASYGFVPNRNTRDAEFMADKWSDHSWRTTLEEDEASLEDLSEDPRNDAIKQILRFRIRMKKSSI